MVRGDTNHGLGKKYNLTRKKIVFTPKNLLLASVI